MIHKTEIDHYSLDGLAQEIANLRYDSLVYLLSCLSKNIAADSVSDGLRDRPKLSGALKDAATCVENAANHIDVAWQHSSPYMGGPIHKRTYVSSENVAKAIGAFKKFLCSIRNPKASELKAIIQYSIQFQVAKIWDSYDPVGFITEHQNELHEDVLIAFCETLEILFYKKEDGGYNFYRKRVEDRREIPRERRTT